MGVIATFYGRKPPGDATLWHKWCIFLPVITLDRQLAIGDVWRRLFNGKWQYQDRPMSDEELADWQSY